MNISELFHSLENTEGGVPRTLAEGVTAQIYNGKQAMISVVRFEPGAEGKLHSHPEEQWGLLIEGDGIRTQSGSHITVSKGDFWQTPGGQEHTFKAGKFGALIFDIFAPPRSDYVPK